MKTFAQLVQEYKEMYKEHLFKYMQFHYYQALVNGGSGLNTTIATESSLFDLVEQTKIITPDNYKDIKENHDKQHLEMKSLEEQILDQVFDTYENYVIGIDEKLIPKRYGFDSRGFEKNTKNPVTLEEMNETVQTVLSKFDFYQIYQQDKYNRLLLVTFNVSIDKTEKPRWVISSCTHPSPKGTEEHHLYILNELVHLQFNMLVSGNIDAFLLLNKLEQLLKKEIESLSVYKKRASPEENGLFSP